MTQYYDGTNNPTTPNYSQAVPVTPCSDGAGANQNFYDAGSGGGVANVEMLPGDQISVENLSDTQTARFRHNYFDIVQLAATLSIEAKIADVIEPQPVLTGKTIDEITLGWGYDQPVTIQSLSNNGGLSQPTLLAATRFYNYSSLAITSNLQFTLFGNTGGGYSESTDTIVKTLSFGNNFVYGDNVSLNGLPVSSAQTYYNTFVTAGQKVVSTSRARNLTLTGGANQKFFIMYPKSWGLAGFQIGVETTNLYRLKKVTGQDILRTILLDGETEEDFSLVNAAGHSEPYYVYESFLDNLGGSGLILTVV